MFWRYGFHQQSPIDALLDRGDLKLEELLDEETLLQECKGNNHKLIEYLTKPEVIEALLCYIVEPPDETMEESVRFKYPTVAAEILSSEVIAICDALINNDEVLEAFWQSLDDNNNNNKTDTSSKEGDSSKEAAAATGEESAATAAAAAAAAAGAADKTPMNPLQASYFAKVFITLLQRKPSETLTFFQSQPAAVDKLLAHIGTSGLMELLLRLISVEEVKERESVFQWLAQQELVAKLVSKFDGNLIPDIHVNAANALLQIVNVTPPFSISGVLIEQIKQGKQVSQLVKYMLDTGAPNHSSSLQNGCVVITTILNHSFHHPQTSDAIPANTFGDYNDMLAILAENMQAFYQILLDSHPTEEVQTAYGKSKPLGVKILRLVELFLSLLRTNTKAINDNFVKLGVIPHLLKLFFQHQWNNFLHTHVYDIIKFVLSKPLESGEELIKSLLVESDLLDRIVEVTKSADAEAEEPKGVRRGYMGHLTLIANALVEFEKSPLSEPMKDKFSSQEWKDYVQTNLAQLNERDSKPLGGQKPTVTTSIREFGSESNLFRDMNSGDAGIDQFGSMVDDEDFDLDGPIPTIASFEMDEAFQANNPFEEGDVENEDSSTPTSDENIDWKANFEEGFPDSTDNRPGTPPPQGDATKATPGDGPTVDADVAMDEESSKEQEQQATEEQPTPMDTVEDSSSS